MEGMEEFLAKIFSYEFWVVESKIIWLLVKGSRINHLESQGSRKSIFFHKKSQVDMHSHSYNFRKKGQVNNGGNTQKTFLHCDLPTLQSSIYTYFDYFRLKYFQKTVNENSTTWRKQHQELGREIASGKQCLYAYMYILGDLKRKNQK